MKKVEFITLDMTPSSSLEWKEAKQQANEIIAQGKKLMWVFETGLFSRLGKPLSDEGQYLNFQLALEHFTSTLGQTFESASQGVVLYKGPGLFSGMDFLDRCQVAPSALALWLREKFKTEALFFEATGLTLKSFDLVSYDVIQSSREGEWLLHLFAIDLMADYLNELSKGIPSSLPVFLQWQPWPEEPVFEALLTNPEKWGRLQILWEGRKNRWDPKFLTESALYWPRASEASPHHFFTLSESLKQMPPVRWIPEEQLTHLWDGLNTLWVLKKALSPQGLRMLAGFEAAGGEVVYLENIGF